MLNKKLAVICAFHCDPYQVLYYKDLFNKYWGSEEDGLYALVSGKNYLKSADFICKELNEIADYVDYAPDLNDHGDTLNRVYKKVPDDVEVVMVMDSDEWIYKEGLIRDFLLSFNDDIDIVGDFCDSGSMRLKDVAHGRFGKCRLNPMIALIRKSVLDKVPDLHFGNKDWKAGEKIDCLDWVVPDNFPPSYGENKCECTDTMGYLGLQLLKLTSNIRLISITQEGLFHAASLSSWVTSYSIMKPELRAGEVFNDRFSWLWWLTKRYSSQFPDINATQGHLKQLEAFAKANNISVQDMEKHQYKVFKQFPALNI